MIGAFFGALLGILFADLSPFAQAKKFYSSVMTQQSMKKILLLVLGVLDIAFLVLSFNFSMFIFSILLLLNVIVFAFIGPFFIIQIYDKQIVKASEYYGAVVEKDFDLIDDELLTKMFEIRISNLRTTIFAYMALLLTYTLTIAVNDTAAQYFNVAGPFYHKFNIGIGVIGFLLLSFAAAGIDKEVITELKELIKAKKRLKKLQKL